MYNVLKCICTGEFYKDWFKCDKFPKDVSEINNLNKKRKTGFYKIYGSAPRPFYIPGRERISDKGYICLSINISRVKRLLPKNHRYYSYLYMKDKTEHLSQTIK